MPSTRSLARAVGACTALALVGIAAAQSGFDGRSPGLELGTRVALRFGTGLVINLLLGGVLLVASPDYAEGKIAEFRSDPGETVVWGLIVGIGVPIVLVVLALTVIGLIVAVPGLFVLAALGIVGSAVMVLVVGSAVTSNDRPRGVDVLLGSLVLALLSAIPLVGGLINWVVGLPGIGMVGHDLYRSWNGR